MSAPTCPRCLDGFLVADQAIDQHTGKYAWLAKCVMCGHRFDPLMTHNRVTCPEPERKGRAVASPVSVEG